MQTITNPAVIGQALAIRRERATKEKDNYALFRQETGVYSVISRQGKAYEATATTCTCADFRSRGRELGACKHVYLVRTAEEERIEAVCAARLANARKHLLEDFPADDPFETGEKTDITPEMIQTETAYWKQMEDMEAYGAWIAEMAEQGDNYPAD